MAQTTRKAARVKAPEPQRYARYWKPRDATGGILRIARGAEVDLYWVREIRADFGRGFAVEKWATGDVYHVCLGGGPGNTDACDCPHGTYRPNAQPCRHVASIRACLKAGRIDG